MDLVSYLKVLFSSCPLLWLIHFYRLRGSGGCTFRLNPHRFGSFFHFPGFLLRLLAHFEFAACRKPSSVGRLTFCKMLYPRTKQCGHLPVLYMNRNHAIKVVKSGGLTFLTTRLTVFFTSGKSFFEFNC